MLYTVKSQLKKEFQRYNHVGDLTELDEKLTKKICKNLRPLYIKLLKFYVSINVTWRF